MAPLRDSWPRARSPLEELGHAVHVLEGHTGAGGNAFWIDPENETIQIVLEVCMDLSEDLEPRSWIFDRFQSVVASAIDD